MAVFRLNVHFSRRKSCATKFLLCENRQQQSCKAFIGLSIYPCKKRLVGDVGDVKIWPKLTNRVKRRFPISIQYSLVSASAVTPSKKKFN